jgi:hypothetical protein
VTDGTPQEVAMAWVRAVMDDADLEAAWPLTDPTLRLVLAQDWVWTYRHHSMIGHNRDWEALAQGLAACPPDHPLWERFAEELLSRWQHIWKGFNATTWRAWDEPEVIALDLEMVTFLESDGGEPVRFEPGRSAFARRFAMRHTDDGWKLASINGDQMFLPGWPPSLGV